MWEFGLGMMLAKLRREHPDDQLRQRLRRQLDARPPDGPFRVITRDHPRWGYLLDGNDERR